MIASSRPTWAIRSPKSPGMPVTVPVPAGPDRHGFEFLSAQDPQHPFTFLVSYPAPHNHDGGDPARYTSFDAPQEHKDCYEPDGITLRPTIPDALDEHGLADNTIVVFTSDHGETFGAFDNFAHKSCPEDVSARVPLIVRFTTAGPEPRRSALLVGTLDLMPTLLEFMGLDMPDHAHGKEMRALDEQYDVRAHRGARPPRKRHLP